MGDDRLVKPKWNVGGCDRIHTLEVYWLQTGNLSNCQISQFVLKTAKQ